MRFHAILLALALGLGALASCATQSTCCGDCGGQACADCPEGGACCGECEGGEACCGECGDEDACCGTCSEGEAACGGCAEGEGSCEGCAEGGSAPSACSGCEALSNGGTGWCADCGAGFRGGKEVHCTGSCPASPGGPPCADCVK